MKNKIENNKMKERSIKSNVLLGSIQTFSFKKRGVL